MSDFRVPRGFAADFAKVAQHYKGTPSEVEEMKACARLDMPAAAESFAAMSKEIAA